MSATADQPTVVKRAPAPGALARAGGIELLGPIHACGYKDGAALVRRRDGQMIQLGPLQYTLLENLDGSRTEGELAAILSERLGRRCSAEQVARLAQKLAEQGLLAGSEHRAPPRRNPLLALRCRVLVTSETATRRITAPFTPLFRPWVMWPVLAAFVGVCWFVLFDKGLAGATVKAFHRPGLLLLVFALAVASAGFHELGHAAAARYAGAKPTGMGVGLYLIWPAFYTDVTDAYRLPRRDRLRVDLAGLYFNALVSVMTMAAWLFSHVDGLLLLIALQLLQMVKQLSPMIRADGYHILADATGVPDLYAHILPTLRRLIPGHRSEPSALTGRARAIVTLWVLLFVPLVLALIAGAVLLLPRLSATAWGSGSAIAAGLPHEAGRGDALGALAALLRLFALILPVLGTALILQKLARMTTVRALAWSARRPARRAALVLAVAAAGAGSAWALWPAGQYRPIDPRSGGKLTQVGDLVAASRGGGLPAPLLPPGRYLAVAMIPRGGATKAHPAFFILRRPGQKHAVALLSTRTPDPATARHLASGATGAAPASVTATTTTTTTTTASATTSGSAAQQAAATAFPFQLPTAPRPGDNQALAIGRTDGGTTYDVAYSVVTVSDGAPATNANGAFAFASCHACATVAVAFQIVLVVGESKVVAPSDAGVALNVDCPACVTLALADQIVATLKGQPTQPLVDQLNATLRELDVLPQLDSVQAIDDEVTTVEHEVEGELNASGLLTAPLGTTTVATTTTTPTTTTSATTTTAPSATPGTTTASPAGTTTTPTSTSETTTATQQTTTTPSTSTTTTTTPTTGSTPTTTTPATTSTTPTTTATTSTGSTTTTPAAGQ